MKATEEIMGAMRLLAGASEPPFPYVVKIGDETYDVVLLGKVLGTFTTGEAALAYTRLVEKASFDA